MHDEKGEQAREAACRTTEARFLGDTAAGLFLPFTDMPYRFEEQPKFKGDNKAGRTWRPGSAPRRRRRAGPPRRRRSSRSCWATMTMPIESRGGAASERLKWTSASGTRRSSVWRGWDARDREGRTGAGARRRGGRRRRARGCGRGGGRPRRRAGLAVVPPRGRGCGWRPGARRGRAVEEVDEERDAVATRARRVSGRRVAAPSPSPAVLLAAALRARSATARRRPDVVGAHAEPPRHGVRTSLERARDADVVALRESGEVEGDARRGRAGGAGAARAARASAGDRWPGERATSTPRST